MYHGTQRRRNAEGCPGQLPDEKGQRRGHFQSFAFSSL